MRAKKKKRGLKFGFKKSIYKKKIVSNPSGRSSYVLAVKGELHE